MIELEQEVQAQRNIINRLLALVSPEELRERVELEKLTPDHETLRIWTEQSSMPEGLPEDEPSAEDW